MRDARRLMLYSDISFACCHTAGVHFVRRPRDTLTTTLRSCTGRRRVAVVPWPCCLVRWASEPAYAAKPGTWHRPAALSANAHLLPSAPAARHPLEPHACQLPSGRQPGQRAPAPAQLPASSHWQRAEAGLDWCQ